ncbi:hypothetical protein J4E89_006181 [Alternaria sp. Ai002NY15]|nr:hypothetical protein J4E89_006181 [Alternaria sp. Ai002NY15]
MASICPTTFRLSKQGEIRRFRKIYTKLMMEPKLERMPEVDQIKIAEAIYRGKLRLYDNGMLDATPRTSDVIATTHRNSVTSPLLLLPAEVRNKIFSYVNSGLHIYMRAGTSFQPVIYIKNGSHANATFEYQPFLTPQGICRQIYSETALLPFTTNEYWYFTKNSLEICKPFFWDQQLQSIRYVSFAITIIMGKFDPVIGNFDAGRLDGLKAFSDLQEVTIYLNMEHPEAERRFEGVKTFLKGYLKEVVSAGVKIVYEHRYREVDFVVWPTSLGRRVRKPGSPTLMI